MLANHNVWSSSRSWVHQFPMLISAFRLPDANGEHLLWGNLYHLSIADLKHFAVKLWSELKVLVSDWCFAIAWSNWALSLLPSCFLFTKKNFDGRNVINKANSIRTRLYINKTLGQAKKLWFNFFLQHEYCTMMFFSKWLVFSGGPSSGPGHVPIARSLTPAAWHMVPHRLVLLRVSNY